MFLGCTFMNILYLWGGGFSEATLMVHCEQQKLRKRRLDHLIEGRKQGESESCLVA